jgi:hypothetical protein
MYRASSGIVLEEIKSSGSSKLASDLIQNQKKLERSWINMLLARSN